MKQLDSKKILYGAHIGEHGFDKDLIIKEIEENCLSRGMNFVTIRTPKRKLVEPEYFIEWAKFCAENKVYFFFLYTLQHAPEDRVSQFTPDLVAQIKEIAGEYFLGDMLGELGSVWVGKLPGYYINGHAPMLPQNAPDMQAAKDSFIANVKNYVDIEHSLGIEDIAVVESSLILPYDLEAGVTIPLSELMGRDPEIVIANARGTALAYKSKFWGSYFAHEWYAGVYHDDALKRRRLELEYKYAYMNGTGLLCHESGDEEITAHGRRYDRDSEISTECRNFIKNFAEYLNEDDRPTSQPIAKVAFMQGNLDSWRGGYGGGFVWSQFEGREWGYNEPEWSWKILQEIGKRTKWDVPMTYACDGNDYSGQVPYGSYDIIPSTSSLEAMCRYDTIIFAGWNSMTEDMLERLEKFVEQGGTLLMSAAHLNASTKRAGEYTPIRGGDLSKLFGVKLTGKTLPYNFGLKFRCDSLVDGFLYPRSLNSYCDPEFSEGYIDYAEVETCGATVTATIENSFHFFDQPGVPGIIENRLGKGVAMLMLNASYPGRDASYPLFRFMTRELIRTKVAKASVKLLAPDPVRYTVYESGDIYMLNTDFDLPATCYLTTDGKREKITLEPLELKHIKTQKEIKI